MLEDVPPKLLFPMKIGSQPATGIPVFPPHAKAVRPGKRRILISFVAGCLPEN